MYGLDFETAVRVADAAPSRGDIVCFIGFIARRKRDGHRTAVPREVKEWLVGQGWCRQQEHKTPAESVADDHELLNVPVPVESFEDFAHLFDWAGRAAKDIDDRFTTSVGAAVRSFFAQGGLRCLVVRVDDPWEYASNKPEEDAATGPRKQRLRKLLPGFGGGALPNASRRSGWDGLGVLFGLPEAAVVCLPDLPEIVADDFAAPPHASEPPTPEVFVECAARSEPPPNRVRPPVHVPVCTDTGYEAWFGFLNAAVRFLEGARRHVFAQALLAVPLPAEGKAPRGRVLGLLQPAGKGLGNSADTNFGIGSRVLQLVFPWVRTASSPLLPGGLEPPDGVFAGLLARSVSTRGAHRSLGRLDVRGVTGFFPPLPSEEVRWSGPPTSELVLIDRVSLLGPSPGGPRVLSDVTTSLLEEEQPAGIERLTLAIVRSARRLGDEVVFEGNSQPLWRRIRHGLENLLDGFFRLGALRGASANEAFEVRCDETTTTQNDLDSGRVVARVRFAPSVPVGWVTVVLYLREGGQISPST